MSRIAVAQTGCSTTHEAPLIDLRVWCNGKLLQPAPLQSQPLHHFSRNPCTTSDLTFFCKLRRSNEYCSMKVSCRTFSSEIAGKSLISRTWDESLQSIQFCEEACLMTIPASFTLRRYALSCCIRKVRAIALCMPPDSCAAELAQREYNYATAQGNDECISGFHWTVPKFPGLRNFSRFATDALMHARREVPTISNAVQGWMFTSRSPSHEEDEDQDVQYIGDSDAGSGSEFEDLEWEDDGAPEEDTEDLQNSDDNEEGDIYEEFTEPREQQPRKSNGREPIYSMRIEAPVDEIYALLHSRGFITPKQKRPTPNDSVLGQEDHRIVTWYRRVSTGLLNYYSCCDNFLKIKAIVNYQLRWSLIHTLSKKHKSSSRQVIFKYGKNLVVTRDSKPVASFLSVEEIKKHQRGFLELDPVPPETLIDVLFSRMKRRSREEKKTK